jgi:hypothetical protein
MIHVWAELQTGNGPVGLWIVKSIVWLHGYLPSFLPEWAKLILLALPVCLLSAFFVFMSVRAKGSDNSVSSRDRRPVRQPVLEGASATVRLRPSLTRIFISIDFFLLIAIVVGYFQQGYMDGIWWTTGYICSFSVALVVTPLLVWLIWVPRVLEYSQNHIRVVTILRESLQPWNHVKSYGYGTGIFTLRFKHEFQGYQIWSKAYSNSDWSQFTDYLENRLPDCET